VIGNTHYTSTLGPCSILPRGLQEYN